MFGNLLEEIEERWKKQEICKHEYDELTDAYDGHGLGIYLCSKCKVLKHEIERRLNV